ncbi:MAG: FtsX-like permease family protein [Anaerolineales bacterium]|nr:FtsX-like permease family protein [Anaerolineales bacterium]
MSFLFRITALFRITFKRLWAQKGLTAVLLLGITAAVALIMTVPLYADAVYFRVLQERISAESGESKRPPFAYLYDYVGAWDEPVPFADAQAVETYLASSGANNLGLPVERFVRYYETDRYKLFPATAENYDDENQSLGIFHFGTASDFAANIELVNGRFPQSNSDLNSPINVLVSENVANEAGFQVGDTFIAYDFVNTDNSTLSQQLVTISGIWRPLDTRSDYWFIAATALDDSLIVAENTFIDQLAPVIPNSIDRALWYFVMDGRNVNTTDVDRLLAGSRRVARQVDTLLPNTRDVVSPTDALVQYRTATQQLQLLLAAFNVPIITLVLAFIILIVGLAVDQRSNEIAIMRSRGSTPWQMVGLATVEGVILGLFAFTLGIILALLLTQLMGKTRSFLDFSAAYPLRVALTKPALRAGLLAIGLAVIAQVLPTLAASRNTIITYKQDQARALKKPFWQRMWLDVILLGITLYGIYLLNQQGSLFSLGEAAQNDLFQNPLLFLLPALAAFSFALLFLRLFPWLMALFSWLLSKTDSVGLLLASRELARTPRAYAMPLILLIITVSLAVFTASLAFTLDLQLIDEARYQIGADVNLRGAGINFNRSSFGSPDGAENGPSNGAIFLPLSEYTEFPGVTGATRVGRYSARAQVGGNRTMATFLGIDRGSFNQVSYWRYDFADRQLNGLLNQLSQVPDGVLVSQPFLQENGLRSGDFVRLTVNLDDGAVEIDAQIVGAFDYFPTWYAEADGPLFVSNLDTLFALTGGDQRYEVWLQTGAPVDEDAFAETLRERHLFGWNWQEPFSTIEQEQKRPERQGLFGQLSIGFVATAVLTVIGFLMYALFSFKRRFVHLGILRAVGLSSWQMSVMVGSETAALILTGLTLGTILGVWISGLFIPFMQIGRSAADLVPPYLVEIAWPTIYQIYLLFLLMFVVALTLLIFMLRRMKIFQAVKLGETI